MGSSGIFTRKSGFKVGHFTLIRYVLSQRHKAAKKSHSEKESLQAINKTKRSARDILDTLHLSLVTATATEN
ncbi:hypothetical protein EAX61_01005 [Dokdonia sinensis]|uniref:Uncharacterized protein n=1 Tax=Dokdonia sinensis TaxID=2479847 RepID=A0A3M0GFX3_9FLAO|nr:hypothetical protein EAX61_01005 [Dokdonia sinensis]